MDFLLRTKFGPKTVYRPGSSDQNQNLKVGRNLKTNKTFLHRSENGWILSSTCLLNCEDHLNLDELDTVYQIQIVSCTKPDLNLTMVWLYFIGKWKWLSANALLANLIKTEYIMTTKSSKLKALDYSPVIELNKKPIARAAETPGLDLIIDETFT